jgi:hypothetical protein
MTDSETLALAHDVRALLQQPAFDRIFTSMRERIVADLERSEPGAAREDLVAELRALKRVRGGFQSLITQAEAIRSNQNSSG